MKKIKYLAMAGACALILSGCGGAAMQMAGGLASGMMGGGAQSNSLKGVEMDFTFVDQVTSMLRVNELMLTRMEISSDAEWPLAVMRPEGEGADIAAYDSWLEQKLKEDFSYFEYYGELSGMEMLGAIGSMGQMFNTAKDRILTEAIKSVGMDLEHQRQVLDYRPDGCVSPAYGGAQSASESVCAAVEKENNRTKLCGFFNAPLEDQLFEFLSGDHSAADWLDTPVDDLCLRPVTALSGSIHKNVNAAFISLLPEHLSEEIQAVESNITEMTEQKSDLEAQIKQAEASEENSISADEITALKQQVTDLEEQIKAGQATYAKLFEEAMGAVEGTDANVVLARQVRRVIGAVDGNLSIASTGAVAVMAKMVIDMKDLARAGLDPLGTAAVMAGEAAGKNEALTAEELQQKMQERVERLIKRSISFLPNALGILNRIMVQRDLVSSKVEYLDKLIKIGEKQG
ncbi:MAG: hypothetical protein HQL54_06515 [Magnetococcales bacterium]|nr:hypothetical protein [Magnetococcales bacterium]